MENKLEHVSMTPKDLTFQLLDEITNHFSEEHEVGRGGYGVVYKGIHNGEEIAVKKLHPSPGLDDEQFKNEFKNLMRAQHQNIVRLVGYCYEIRHKLVEYNGGHILARVEERILCFEYLQGGSLDKHLSDESCGLPWPERYKIIRGTCEGLNYLHTGSSDPIYHLDLKPANILLDKNMIPKIGDFGLSRLFASTQTHTTKNIIGTRPYMPPEYISKGQISKEYDVFSLGVTIIHIMTGPEGYTKCADMPFQEFIELVQMNWRRRIDKASNHVEEYCSQVKKCIEIALNCVEYDKGKRPIIGDIIQELKQTETNIIETQEEEKGAIVSKMGELDTVIHELSISHDSGSVSTHSKGSILSSGKEVSFGLQITEEKGEPDMEKAGPTKNGPWGGDAGWAYTLKVAPHHLESVTIWSADIIDAFAFSYSNIMGEKHIKGPWGGPGGSAYTIQLGPSEYLIEVSGITGPYICAVADVVKSLSFVTNENRYGPFGAGGGEEGTPFHTSMNTNGSIVGFFARAGSFVHAIGVYVRPDRDTTERENVRDVKIDLDLETMERERGKDEHDVHAKLGPWGGNGGMAHDMKVVPHRLESLTICSADIINSLALSYNDHNGRQHTVGPWGGDSGNAYTIRLGPFEHLTGMSGTIGSFGTLRNVITSLTFVTNLKRSYGPFGQGGGTQFKVPVERNGGIVGFFGYAGSHVEALGVYIRRYWL